MDKISKEIRDLAKEKDAVILAHYYVDGAVQDIADYVGDSFYLAKVAKSNPHKTIVFCGVTFMGQSASILSPDKTVLMPDLNAVCPMALMVDADKIRQMREQYDDLAVVCYINSMAEIKALSDVCVTSSNALNIVFLQHGHVVTVPLQGNVRRRLVVHRRDEAPRLHDGQQPLELAPHGRLVHPHGHFVEGADEEEIGIGLPQRG